MDITIDLYFYGTFFIIGLAFICLSKEVLLECLGLVIIIICFAMTFSIAKSQNEKVVSFTKDVFTGYSSNKELTYDAKIRFMI